MQRGQIFRRGGSWYLRFYQNEIKEGKPFPRRVCRRLARYSDAYRSKRDVWPLAEEILSPQNTGQLQPESALTFSEFVEKQFLPHIEKKKKPSTLKFYRDVYKNHLRDRVGRVRLRDFTTRHAQDLIDAIPGLSHQSLLRVKTGLSAVFTFARQRDVIRTANPVQGVKAEGRRTNPERYAYSLDEVRHMLSVLPDPARTVVAVAAFAGLRAGEIRGLRWEDFTGEQLAYRAACGARTWAPQKRRKAVKIQFQSYRCFVAFWRSIGTTLRTTATVIFSLASAVAHPFIWTTCHVAS
jgi:integrase